MLVAFREKRFTKKLLLEKSILLALIGAILMGSANFFIGWGARVTDPLTVNFFVDAFLAIMSFIIIYIRGRVDRTISDIRNNVITLVPMSIADKIAWIAFAFSMAVIPIAIATALSESYIIVAVIFGLVVNKERLHKHQMIGMACAIIAAVSLAMITANR